MSSEAEENKAIVRRSLEETKAKGNLEVIDELAAPNFVDRSLMPGQGPTREDYKLSMKESNDAFLSPALPSRSRSPRVTPCN